MTVSTGFPSLAEHQFPQFVRPYVSTMFLFAVTFVQAAGTGRVRIDSSVETAVPAA